MRGRRILVTGAAGGLGQGMIAAFSSAGATVFAMDRIAPQQHQGVIPIQCDITDTDEMCDRVKGHLSGGEIDTLVNNAAIYPAGPFQGSSLDEHRAVQAVNVDAPVSLMQLLLPGMAQRQFGRVINITSVTLSGNWSDLSSYVASKGALLGLTRAWAREFGPMGITVNAVSPGAIPTKAEAIHPDPEAYARNVLEQQAIKQRGSPDDIANAVLFLADDTTGFITGHTLHVDGGWTMQ